MANFNMDDYVDVAERMRLFYERYPTGSLKSGHEPRLVEAGGKAFIVYHAQAFRTPDDPRPADGWAWEPVPGPTQFTKDSELMNAETAAWGRAIVACGFETKKVASRNEVQNRQPHPQGQAAASTPVVTWRTANFNPAEQLVTGAPPGWGEIQTLILDLDSTLGGWVSEAILSLYGSAAKDIADDVKRAEAWRRTANALARIRDDLFAAGDFPPPSDDDYRVVFAWAFDGVRVEGPGHPFSDALAHEGDVSEAVPAGTGGAESDTDVPPQAGSLLAASQGHVGTGEPDA